MAVNHKPIHQPTCKHLPMTQTTTTQTDQLINQIPTCLPNLLVKNHMKHSMKKTTTHSIKPQPNNIPIKHTATHHSSSGLIIRPTANNQSCKQTASNLSTNQSIEHNQPPNQSTNPQPTTNNRPFNQRITHQQPINHPPFQCMLYQHTC